LGRGDLCRAPTYVTEGKKRGGTPPEKIKLDGTIGVPLLGGEVAKKIKMKKTYLRH